MKKFNSIFLPLLISTVLAVLIAKLSYVQTGTVNNQGQIVITARLTKAIIKTCRDYTEAELKSIPIHMRTVQLCEQSAKPYQLQVFIDKKLAAEENMQPQTSRGDHPMNLQKVLTLAPGNYMIQIILKPKSIDTVQTLPIYSYDGDVLIEKSKKVFFTLDESGKQFTQF